MDNLILMQMDHCFDQLEHQTLNLGQAEELAFVHHPVDELGQVDVAVLKD